MKVMVWHHNHGEYYYDASTPEAEEASAREVLRDMVKNQMIVPPEDPMKHIQYSSIDLEQARLTDEQIDALPLESLRDEARMHKNKLARRIKIAAHEAEQWDELQRFLASEVIMSQPWVRRSGPRVGETVAPKPIPARMILQQWADGGEYTRVEVETVWTPDD